MRSFYVQWHILDRCNLRCRHCYQDDFSPQRELTLPQLKAISANLLETMKKWRSRLDVALTGGEPFLKKELPDLLEHLASSPQVARISIITNGLVIPRWIKELKNFRRFKEIKVSLDGAAEATNDSLRGEGTFVQVLAGIKKFRALDLPVIIMFTAMKRNQAEVEQLFDLAREVGARGLIIERFFPLGQGKNLEAEVLSGAEFKAIWDKVIARCKLTASAEELIPYRAIKVELGQRRPRVYGSECIVGRDGLALMPDGTIFPCRRFPLPLGNLLTNPLAEIWESSLLLKELRDKNKLGGKCRSCGIEDCGGCRAMTYALTGDPFAPDPHCWLT